MRKPKLAMAALALAGAIGAAFAVSGAAQAAPAGAAIGDAAATLSVVSGPDLVGASLPPGRLRPVEARSERQDSGADRTDRAIPDLGQVDSTVTIDAPPGAKTHGVDVSWTFDHSYRGDLELILEGCAAIRVPDAARTAVLRRRYLALLLAGLSDAGDDTPLPGPGPASGELNRRWRG